LASKSFTYHKKEEHMMRKRLAAAVIGGATLVGGTVLAQAGVAKAEVITVTVCNRQVLTPTGWECVEYTTCLVDHRGNYVCDDNNRWIGPAYA
jgi:hypothetical protein